MSLTDLDITLENGLRVTGRIDPLQIPDLFRDPNDLATVVSSGTNPVCLVLPPSAVVAGQTIFPR